METLYYNWKVMDYSLTFENKPWHILSHQDSFGTRQKHCTSCVLQVYVSYTYIKWSYRFNISKDWYRYFLMYKKLKRFGFYMRFNFITNVSLKYEDKRQKIILYNFLSRQLYKPIYFKGKLQITAPLLKPATAKKFFL